MKNVITILLISLLGFSCNEKKRSAGELNAGEREEGIKACRKEAMKSVGDEIYELLDYVTVDSLVKVYCTCTADKMIEQDASFAELEKGGEQAVMKYAKSCLDDFQKVAAELISDNMSANSEDDITLCDCISLQKDFPSEEEAREGLGDYVVDECIKLMDGVTSEEVELACD